MMKNMYSTNKANIIKSVSVSNKFNRHPETTIA